MQINFRNHRKIVVVDGDLAFVGGLNVGTEYLGKSKKYGAWRDTHVSVEGPSADALQLIFAEDWHWATGETIEGLEWETRTARDGNADVLVLPGGPADEYETCNLMFVHAIHSAQHRFWIASPYFVPNAEVVSALQVAGLRGVDVRILLPANPDHFMVYLASFYLMKLTGGKWHSFLPLHQGFHASESISDRRIRRRSRRARIGSRFPRQRPADSGRYCAWQPTRVGTGRKQVSTSRSKCLRIVWIMPMAREAVGLAVPDGNASAFCRKPQIAIGILVDSPDVVAAESIRIAEFTVISVNAEPAPECKPCSSLQQLTAVAMMNISGRRPCSRVR